MAHLRSDFTVRVRRTALPPVPGHVQTSALLVRGLAPSGRFHVQVTASTHQQGSDELLFRMIPDLDVLDAQLLNTDPDWITITFRGIGEMHGNRNTAVPNAITSWINLSPFESDEFVAPRAFVHLKVDAADLQTWQAMDAAILSLGQRMAGAPAEYRVSIRQRVADAAVSARAARFPNGIAGSGPPITRPGHCGWATTPPHR